MGYLSNSNTAQVVNPTETMATIKLGPSYVYAQFFLKLKIIGQDSLNEIYCLDN